MCNVCVYILHGVKPFQTMVNNVDGDDNDEDDDDDDGNDDYDVGGDDGDWDDLKHVQSVYVFVCNFVKRQEFFFSF